MIVTFYNDRINGDILSYQKRVFDYFGETIHQIKPNNWRGHPEAIDDYLQNYIGNWEYVVLIDVDCIPLDKNIIPEVISWIKNNVGIYALAQHANHMPDSIIYASAAFMGFSKKTYELLGKPLFSNRERGDCGVEFTHKANELGYAIKFMYPTSVEIPKWNLTENIKFGVGTTYDNRVYHLFEGRAGEINRFLRKCNEVLNGDI